MWQITIGHLGHFLLDFFAQIWTQETLRHMLGPILVIFEICQFLKFRGLFEYFSENGWSQKIKVFIDEGAIVTPFIGLVLEGQVPRLNHGPISFPIQNTWGVLQALKSQVSLLTLSQRVKVHFLLTYYIKNLSIGVA